MTHINLMIRSALRSLVLAALAAFALSGASLPNPAVDESKPAAKTETAILAGGCFWGIEAVFDATKGVSDAVSGYAGGSKANAHYEIVSSGTTGHAESVQVTFDPSQVSFGQLLAQDLLFRSRPHSVEPSRSGRRNPVPV